MASQPLSGNFILMRQLARKASATAAQKELNHNVIQVGSKGRDESIFSFGKRYGLGGEIVDDSQLVAKCLADGEKDIWVGGLIEPPFDSTLTTHIRFIVASRDTACNISVGIIDADACKELMPIDGGQRAKDGKKGRGPEGQSLCNHPGILDNIFRAYNCMLYCGSCCVFTDKGRKIGSLEPARPPRVAESVAIQINNGVPSFFINEEKLNGVIDLSSFKGGKLPARAQFVVDLGPMPRERKAPIGGGKMETRLEPSECSLRIAPVGCFADKTFERTDASDRADAPQPAAQARRTGAP